eukprot:3901804-Rhodomonas_salina.2
MAMGVHCFQLAFDSLEEGGYVHVGMAKENINYNSDAIPPDDYNCHGYTTIGEIYAAGRLVKSGLEKIRQGDVMIMVVDFSDRSIVWYKNDCPVGRARLVASRTTHLIARLLAGFYEGFEGTNLYPCVVLGHKGYKVSITRALSVPHPIMKWDSAGKADGITLVSCPFHVHTICGMSCTHVAYGMTRLDTVCLPKAPVRLGILPILFLFVALSAGVAVCSGAHLWVLRQAQSLFRARSRDAG